MDLETFLRCQLEVVNRRIDWHLDRGQRASFYAA